jgi:hypothetical protein
MAYTGADAPAKIKPTATTIAIHPLVFFHPFIIAFLLCYWSMFQEKNGRNRAFLFLGLANNNRPATDCRILTKDK